MSSLASLAADTEKMNIRGSHVVHGLFTEMVLNSYDITRNALSILAESQS